MLSIPPCVQIFIARAPVDMRKSFDALENLVRVVLEKDPMSGHLFIFTNKRRDRLKILMWGAHGWSILYNRLEVGTYKLPEVSAIEDGNRVQVEAAELVLMLEGIDLTGLTAVSGGCRAQRGGLRPRRRRRAGGRQRA